MKNFKMVFVSSFFVIGFLFLTNVESVRAQSMEWSGTVDDVIQIRIRNRSAQTRGVSGRTYYDANYDFNGRAPRRNATARVDKHDGRGRVFIIQQPSRRNNWTTIVQIVDSKGGTDRYRFSVYWD